MRFYRFASVVHDAIVILGWELVGAMDHNLPSFPNMPPNYKPRRTLVLLIGEPIEVGPRAATFLWVVFSKFVMEHVLEIRIS